MEQEAMKKGVDTAKEFAEHVQRLTANVLTRETMEHVARAATEMVKAANAMLEEAKLPSDTKKHLIRAEKEMILAARDVLDAVLQELTRIEKGEEKKRDKLKKIEIKE